MMIKTMDHIERRLKAYWFIDGLAEIGCGLLFLVLSLPYLAWSLLPEGSSSAKIASTSRDVILLAGLVCLFVVIGAAKQRSTYPRSGYIQEQNTFERKTVRAVLITIGGLLGLTGLLTAGILFVPAVRAGLLTNIIFLPACLGGLFATGMIIISSKTGVRRFYWLAAFIALISSILAIISFRNLSYRPLDLHYFLNSSATSPMPDETSAELKQLFHSLYQQVAFLLAFSGLAMVVSGGSTRRKYLSENPLYKMAADDR
jgi:hypothetical protein